MAVKKQRRGGKRRIRTNGKENRDGGGGSGVIEEEKEGGYLARTLKFRQHPLLPYWLSFVIGLVRLAEFNARIYDASGPEGEYK